MIIKTLILLLLFSQITKAEDFGIAMPGQLTGSDLSGELNEDVSTIPGLSSDIETDGTEQSPTIMDSVSKNLGKQSFKSKLLRADAGVPYEFENSEQLVSIKNENIVESIYNKGTSIFSLSYIKDQYDASDPGGVFQRTYERSTGSVRGGSLHFELDNVAYQNIIRVTYGFAFGVGLSQGKGSFATSPGLESSANFSLYTLPVDLRLGLDLINMKNFKLSLAGGPSVMGLYQSRSDKEDGQEGKRIRQYSFGYFGQAKLKIGLGLFSSKGAVSNFNNYDMTNMSINLETRFQTYEKFQNAFTLTGASFGLGCSFEYL
jgi:hypothetical protein